MGNRRFEYVKRINGEDLENTDMCIDFDLPKRSTAKSAGYDFYVPERTVCKSHEITMVRTGVKAYMEEGETLLLHIRKSS